MCFKPDSTDSNALLPLTLHTLPLQAERRQAAPVCGRHPCPCLWPHSWRQGADSRGLQPQPHHRPLQRHRHGADPRGAAAGVWQGTGPGARIWQVRVAGLLAKCFGQALGQEVRGYVART
jgi:hypothetical protein